MTCAPATVDHASATLTPTCVHRRRLQHVFHTDKSLYLAFEFCDSDLKQYMRSIDNRMPAAAVQSYSWQLINGISWCHSHRIFHRDLKPQNLLVQPARGVLKIGDFGLTRAFALPLRSYTHEVVTLWYRAPEILLGAKDYACPIDMWSVGCVLGEMATGKPMFPGDSEIDEIFKIFRVLGTPNETLWTGVSQLPDFKTSFPKWQPKQLREVVPQTDRLNDEGLDLVKHMLLYTPQARITAKDALEHPYFNGLNLDTVGKIPLPF